MTRLKLADLADEKPVRLTLEVSTQLHRDLLAYAIALNDGQASGAPSPERLVPAMLQRFIATDRAFARGRKNSRAQ